MNLSNSLQKRDHLINSIKHEHSCKTLFIMLFIFSSRMIEIQSQLSERAIELLALPDDRPCFILDVGYVQVAFRSFLGLTD